MSKVEAVCPFCNKPSAFEKSSHADVYGLQRVQCPHCSKQWSENLSATGALSKSAPSPSSELAQLRVQLNAQFAELLSKLQGLIERRATPPRSVSFQPMGEGTGTVQKVVAGMPGGAMAESDIAEAAEASRQSAAFVTKAANSDAVAHAELQKALANGKPITSPNYTRLDDGLEKAAPSRFNTVESVAPGVQQFHSMPANSGRASAAAPAEHRPFQPGGETDLSKAHAAVNHALANGKRV